MLAERTFRDAIGLDVNEFHVQKLHSKITVFSTIILQQMNFLVS